MLVVAEHPVFLPPDPYECHGICKDVSRPEVQPCGRISETGVGGLAQGREGGRKWGFHTHAHTPKPQDVFVAVLGGNGGAVRSDRRSDT